MCNYFGCFFYMLRILVHFGTLNKVAYWINLNKVAQIHKFNWKNTQFYLVLISSTLHYILPKYTWYQHDVGFKFNSWKFAKNVGIEVSYTSGRDLQPSLKSQKNEENTTHAFYQINYKNSHIEFPRIRWVITQRNASQEVALNLILLSCQLTSFNW